MAKAKGGMSGSMLGRRSAGAPRRGRNQRVLSGYLAGAGKAYKARVFGSGAAGK